MDHTPPRAVKARNNKGRGTFAAIDPRYLKHQRVAIADNEEEAPPIRTEVRAEKSRSIISTNNSPDLPFTATINPYRGCEHGCIYCYARPTHAYLDLSPGIDFETRLFAKPNAAELLRRALSAPAYQCTPIALGANTDPYQPIERDWKITRSILEVLHEYRHPCTIVTKSWLVERDIDVLREMAANRLVRVFLSVTTLDRALARVMEPRATAPDRRLATIKRLHEAGIETGVMFAPVIPALNDYEMEAVLSAAAQAGAEFCGYVLLRLPLEVEPLFIDWLTNHFPDKAEHVLSLIRQSRGGKLNQAGFHERFRGKGVYAEMIAQRFRRARRKLNYFGDRTPLNTSLYNAGGTMQRQLDLFQGGSE